MQDYNNRALNIIHISNDFLGSSVYQNLFKALNNTGVEKQIVYTAYNPRRVETNTIPNIDNVDACLRPILDNWTRINFFYKKRKIINDIESQIDFEKVKRTKTIIHSHTWYSDGSIAYELYKLYKIPYIVTVRNTDINFFFKYYIHLRSYGLSILLNAEKIILISTNYKKRLLESSFFQKQSKSILNKIEEKLLFIPNGVDYFWINNLSNKSIKIKNKIPHFIYVGKFDKGKNVYRLMKAIVNLNKQGVFCRLILVGGGGSDHKRIAKTILKYPEIFDYKGVVKEKDSLKEIYRSADIFAMPSLRETFGLVYIEALTQGLPVLYTKNEGIDGLYNNIGEKVDASNVKDITAKLLLIINRYCRYCFDIQAISQNHNWDKIANEYIEKIYTI